MSAKQPPGDREEREVGETTPMEGQLDPDRAADRRPDRAPDEESEDAARAAQEQMER